MSHFSQSLKAEYWEKSLDPGVLLKKMKNYGFLKFQDAPRLDVYFINLTTIKAVQATFPVLCSSGAVLSLLLFRT